ncbi:peptidylprolyl isomerase [Caldichromatium japonicum]|uniref:peptidylprolyl isomerase n=1 Tax=Caldichromatium japonicum TaxID=2699430 RepID=A0A6G7VFD5_9GAMM|nr:peptidyl-prolyl cis-trans isomerase [Caldichromatium japonicum]QIK38610.1 peptidylprolyl isomerase [Caldichromatium japonicum]
MDKRLLLLVSAFSFAIAYTWAQDNPPPSATSSPATPQQMPRVVMARINDREITVEEFMQFLAKNPTRVHEATTDAGKAQLLRELIEIHLLMQAMRDEGLIGSDAEPTNEELKKAFLKFSQKHFPPPPPPSEEAMRAYYEEHRSEFGIPAAVRLSQIQFRVKDPDSQEEKAAARKRAEEALARIKAGEPFAKVAAELTENTRYRETGGDVGFVKREGNAWLEQALRNLKVGEHTGVLESPVGYDILLLTDEREAVITPFEEVRNSIASQMQIEEQKKAKEKYVKNLARQAKIEIVLDELKDDYPHGVFPETER